MWFQVADSNHDPKLIYYIKTIMAVDEIPKGIRQRY
jgi:hypothetical protein